LTEQTVEEHIRDILEKNPVVLFMKGTSMFPQCGFSGRAVEVLKACNAEFTSVNVLSDYDVREGIKTYANWPTIPQLYIKGEFIGGCDIIVDMAQSGELQKLLAGATA